MQQDWNSIDSEEETMSSEIEFETFRSFTYTHECTLSDLKFGNKQLFGTKYSGYPDTLVFDTLGDSRHEMLGKLVIDVFIRSAKIEELQSFTQMGQKVHLGKTPDFVTDSGVIYEFKTTLSELDSNKCRNEAIDIKAKYGKCKVVFLEITENSLRWYKMSSEVATLLKNYIRNIRSNKRMNSVDSVHQNFRESVFGKVHGVNPFVRLQDTFFLNNQQPTPLNEIPVTYTDKPIDRIQKMFRLNHKDLCSSVESLLLAKIDINALLQRESINHGNVISPDPFSRDKNSGSKSSYVAKFPFWDSVWENDELLLDREYGTNPFDVSLFYEFTNCVQKLENSLDDNFGEDIYNVCYNVITSHILFQDVSQNIKQLFVEFSQLYSLKDDVRGNNLNTKLNTLLGTNDKYWNHDILKEKINLYAKKFSFGSSRLNWKGNIRVTIPEKLSDKLFKQNKFSKIVNKVRETVSDAQEMNHAMFEMMQRVVSKHKDDCRPVTADIVDLDLSSWVKRASFSGSTSNMIIESFRNLYPNNTALNDVVNLENEASVNTILDIMSSENSVLLRRYCRIATAYLLAFKGAEMNKADKKEMVVLTVPGFHGFIIATPPPNQEVTGTLINVCFQDTHGSFPRFSNDYQVYNKPGTFKYMLISRPYRMNYRYLENVEKNYGAYVGNEILLRNCGCNFQKTNLYKSLYWDYNRSVASSFDFVYLMYKISFSSLSMGRKEILKKVDNIPLTDVRAHAVIKNLLTNYEGFSDNIYNTFVKMSEFNYRDAVFGTNEFTIQAFSAVNFLRQIFPKNDGYDPMRMFKKFIKNESIFEAEWSRSKYNPMNSGTEPDTFSVENLSKEFRDVANWDPYMYDPLLIDTGVKKLCDEAKRKNGSILFDVMNTGNFDRDAKTSKVHTIRTDDEIANVSSMEYSEKKKNKYSHFQLVNPKPLSEVVHEDADFWAKEMINFYRFAGREIGVEDLAMPTLLDITASQIPRYPKCSVLRMQIKDQTGTDKRAFFIMDGCSRNGNKIRDEACKVLLQKNDTDVICKSGDEKTMALERKMKEVGSDGKSVMYITVDQTKFGDKYVMEAINRIIWVMHKEGILNDDELRLLNYFDERIKNRVLLIPPFIAQEFQVRLGKIRPNKRQVKSNYDWSRKYFEEVEDLISDNILNDIEFHNLFDNIGDNYKRTMIRDICLKRSVGFILGVLNFSGSVMSTIYAEYFCEHWNKVVNNSKLRFGTHSDDAMGFCSLIPPTREEVVQALENGEWKELLLLLNSSDPNLEISIDWLLNDVHVQKDASYIEPEDGGIVSQTHSVQMVQRRFRSASLCIAFFVLSYIYPKLVGQTPSAAKYFLGPAGEMLQITFFAKKCYVPVIRYTSAVLADLTNKSFKEDLQSCIGRVYNTLCHIPSGAITNDLMVACNILVREKYRMPFFRHSNKLPAQLGGIWYSHPALLTTNGFSANKIRLLVLAKHLEEEGNNSLKKLNTLLVKNTVNFNDSLEDNDLDSGLFEVEKDFMIGTTLGTKAKAQLSRYWNQLRFYFKNHNNQMTFEDYMEENVGEVALAYLISDKSFKLNTTAFLKKYTNRAFQQSYSNTPTRFFIQSRIGYLNRKVFGSNEKGGFMVSLGLNTDSTLQDVFDKCCDFLDNSGYEFQEAESMLMIANEKLFNRQIQYLLDVKVTLERSPGVDPTYIRSHHLDYNYDRVKEVVSQMYDDISVKRALVAITENILYNTPVETHFQYLTDESVVESQLNVVHTIQNFCFDCDMSNEMILRNIVLLHRLFSPKGISFIVKKPVFIDLNVFISGTCRVPHTVGFYGNIERVQYRKKTNYGSHQTRVNRLMDCAINLTTVKFGSEANFDEGVTKSLKQTTSYILSNFIKGNDFGINKLMIDDKGNTLASLLFSIQRDRSVGTFSVIYSKIVRLRNTSLTSYFVNFGVKLDETGDEVHKYTFIINFGNDQSYKPEFTLLACVMLRLSLNELLLSLNNNNSLNLILSLKNLTLNPFTLRLDQALEERLSRNQHIFLLPDYQLPPLNFAINDVGFTLDGSKLPILIPKVSVSKKTLYNSITSIGDAVVPDYYECNYKQVLENILNCFSSSIHNQNSKSTQLLKTSAALFSMLNESLKFTTTSFTVDSKAIIDGPSINWLESADTEIFGLNDVTQSISKQSKRPYNRNNKTLRKLSAKLDNSGQDYFYYKRIRDQIEKRQIIQEKLMGQLIDGANQAYINGDFIPLRKVRSRYHGSSKNVDFFKINNDLKRATFYHLTFEFNVLSDNTNFDYFKYFYARTKLSNGNLFKDHMSRVANDVEFNTIRTYSSFLRDKLYGSIPEVNFSTNYTVGDTIASLMAIAVKHVSVENMLKHMDIFNGVYKQFKNINGGTQISIIGKAFEAVVSSRVDLQPLSWFSPITDTNWARLNRTKSVRSSFDLICLLTELGCSIENILNLHKVMIEMAMHLGKRESDVLVPYSIRIIMSLLSNDSFKTAFPDYSNCLSDLLKWLVDTTHDFSYQFSNVEDIEGVYYQELVSAVVEQFKQNGIIAKEIMVFGEPYVAQLPEFFIDSDKDRLKRSLWFYELNEIRLDYFLGFEETITSNIFSALDMEYEV